MILYEQPLNESLRICLRLECLFQRMLSYSKANYTSPHSAIVTITELIDAVDRPDLKNKISKFLWDKLEYLKQIEEAPQVNEKGANTTIDKLKTFIDSLHCTTEKLGHDLRNNQFLATIKQKLIISGGTSSFSIPAYHLWLHYDNIDRKKDLDRWLDSFRELKAIVDLLLKLVRSDSFKETKIACAGFYQETLSENNYQMIGISIPKTYKVYPEISLGKHRLSIHFFELNIEDKDTH